MDRAVHELRNDLAGAMASMRAFLDGKLEPNQQSPLDVRESLEDLDALAAQLRSASRGSGVVEKENLLSAIIEGSPYASILVNGRGKIALVNAQTERLFGYSRAELLGQSIEMLVSERFRPGHPGLRDAFNHGPIARPMGAGRDLFGRCKDGTEVPIEIGLDPIETEAGSFTLAAITDITERKRAEELRLIHAGVQQRADELEKLNHELASASRFKTQFVATMSHELRTPLAAIIGASELLSRSKLDAREQTCVQTIAESAEALFALINSILDFSKIEAGKLDLQTASIEIEMVLESAAEVIAQLARDKGITLYTYVDPMIPPVQGDGGRLRQILLNLLGNAVKFTERGRVVVRALLLDALPAEIVVCFEVKDTGIGIAPEVLSSLFEPFAQADNWASRRFGGTGLGLSISKRLVELMGGNVGVQSDPGGGSVFWFTARFERAAERATLQRRTLEGIGALILSGDDLIAETIESYIRSWSMECRRAGSRNDVVEVLQSRDSATWAVIVDLDDVGVADLGVTIDSLRAILPDRIIAIGNDGPLRKPLRQSHLFDAIVKAVSGKRAEAIPIPPPGPVEAIPRPGAPVLVAEDNVHLQRLLKLQFDDLGVPVTFVSDGLQATEALSRNEYAMMFMDYQMPNMDGMSATKAIRNEERQNGGHVPIVAMTANAFAEDREACLAAGMDDYLAKPVKLADLRAVIERWSSPSRPSGRSG
jgi:PAS domain S-box-containing protein